MRTRSGSSILPCSHLSDSTMEKPMPPHERDLAAGRSIQSKDGTIVFYEHFRAPLQSGNYELTVTQSVASSDEKNAFDETFEQHVTFAVQGTRFTLSPDA